MGAKKRGVWLKKQRKQGRMQIDLSRLKTPTAKQRYARDNRSKWRYP